MEHHRKIGLAVRMLSIQIGRFVDSVSDKNITGLQGHILSFIRRNSRKSDVFQKDVENEFGIRRSTATGILQSMEKNGLLTREAVPYDARMKKIVLTEKALNLHNQIIERLERMERQLRDHIEADEIDAFFAIADKIMRNIPEE